MQERKLPELKEPFVERMKKLLTNEKDFKEDSYKHKYDDKIKGKEIKILFNKLN